MVSNSKTISDSIPELLSLKKTCEVLKCHPNTLRQWDRNGVLKAVRFGKRQDRRYRKEDILKILKTRMQESSSLTNQYGLDFFEREAETAIERISRLQVITAALSRAVSMKDISDIVLTQAVAACGSCCGLIAFVNRDEGTLDMYQHSGFTKREINKIRKLPLITVMPITDAARSGDPIFVESRDESKVRYPFAFSLNKQLNHESCAVIPLVTNHKVLGVVGFFFEQPRQFSRNDVSFMLALTRQSAQALDRARLFEAEQVARNSAESLESQFRNVLARMHDGFTSFDPDWNVTYINSRAEALLQTTYEQIIGRPVKEFYPPSEHREYYEKAEEVMKSRKECSYEGYFQVTDKWFHITIYPSQDGIATVFQDITERKLLEHRLSVAEKTLASLQRKHRAEN